MAAELVGQTQPLRPPLHKGAVARVQIDAPHPLHLGQRCGRQGMAADATAEVEHLTAGELFLQPQGIGDVVGAAQMPGGQLQQVAIAHALLVEGRGPPGIKGTGVQAGQIGLSLRQTRRQLGGSQSEELRQLFPQRKAVGQETLQRQLRTWRGCRTGRFGRCRALRGSQWRFRAAEAEVTGLSCCLRGWRGAA